MKDQLVQRTKYDLDAFIAKRNDRLQKIAMKLASKASSILYQYGAKRVFIFGSVLKKGRFYQSSDIDLAVEGLSKEKRFRVESHLMDIFEPEGYDFDLVVIEDLKKRESSKARAILEKIYQESKCVTPE